VTATTSPVDGRTLRALRTREAVVEALLALIEDGDLRPTAPRIAERAGVSLRSVFQHFTDLEALFHAVAERQFERIAAQVGPLPDGSLDERLEAFVAQRTRVLEFLTPVRRAALLQEPFSAELRASRDRLMRLARQEVATVFSAELGALPPGDRGDLLDALDAAASWPAWEQLRAGQGLAVPRARRVFAGMLAALLRGHAS
jgi:TetR/AcrR family transcriptional regulator of autoinduction and epiphytic fitness